MGYSPDQITMYQAKIEGLDIVFKKAKDLVSTCKCPIHNKKASLNYDYLDDYQTRVFLKKYCCIDFANQIVATLKEAQLFDLVEI